MKNRLLRLRESPAVQRSKGALYYINTTSLSIVEPRVFGALQKPIFHIPWV